jgi:DNA-binding SARP family transcriptional activator/predicted ATPase
MQTLTLRLLGTMDVLLDGQPVRLVRRSALALVVYLAHAGSPQSRKTLASLIAGESDEAKAGMALSNALRDLRFALGKALLTDARMVGLSLWLTIDSDMAVFEEAVRAGMRDDDAFALRAAVDRYGGTFAPGLALRGAPELDEWLTRERDRLRDLFLAALERLAHHESLAGNLQAAITITRRLLAEDPWREEAHRSLMRFLARSGQRTAALRQFERCRAVLARDLGVPPHPETQALYTQLQAGPVAPLHNLPARTTTYIDRPVERTLLITQLQQPDCRLVTILGIGGAGKTRLAIEVAASFTLPDLADDLIFPDGVFFIPGSERDETSPTAAQQLPQAILHVIRVAPEPGVDALTAVLGWLAPRRVLLVLDNAESNPGAASFARDALTVAPRVRLLVTSRLRLRLDAEWVLDLGGLSVPVGAEEVPSSEAGQLFLARARHSRLQHDLDREAYPHIARICQFLSGLPLGIVLAAGQLRSLSCAEIANRLERDAHILVGQSGDLPERQRDLRAVLRWSFDQLDGTESRCLRTLAVFAGTFDLLAAEAVSTGTTAPLGTLADAGLLAVLGEQAYSLHPLVRQLAAEELAGVPEERAAAEQRHADHFAGRVATVIEQLKQNTAALAELTACWNDLRQAWSWAISQRRMETITRLRPVMQQGWYALSLFREGVAQCEQAVAAIRAGRPDDQLSASAAAEIAELLLVAAGLAIHESGSAPVLTILNQAQALAARLADEESIQVRVDYLIGMQLFLNTRYRAARPRFERALAAAVQRDDQAAELALLSVLARAAYRQGDRTLMQMMLDAVARRFSADETAIDYMLVRYAAAHLAAEAGDVAPAYTLLSRHAGDHDLPNHFNLRFWHWSLQVTVATAEGRLGDAEQINRRAEYSLRMFGNIFVRPHATALLAGNLLAQGDHQAADERFATAEHQALALDMPRPRSEALLGRSQCAWLRGDTARALPLVAEALRIAQDEAYVRFERQGLMILGRLQAELGQNDAALGSFKQVVAADLAFGNAALAAEAAVAFAEVRQRQEAPAEGRDMLEPYLPTLLHSDLIGADDPIRALVGAATVLAAASDKRAVQLLERAGIMFTRRLALVAPERRRHFAEHTAAHRALARDLDR